MIYRKYSDYLKEVFNEKVYKLPIKLNLTCPNRDGKLGYGGCSFCGEEGGSFENSFGTIEEQLLNNKELIKNKYNAKKFIAYFQNFTNTYIDFNAFKANIEECFIEDIVGISISTRPDCLPDKFLDFLEEVNEKYMVTIELGLQTANYRTLKKINRGHGLAEFIDAVLRIHKRGIRVCVHVILNLPYDDELDTIETAHILNALSVEEVKIHALYILKGTELGKLYEEDKINLISLNEYEDRVIKFLQHLDNKIVIQRIIGRAPEENSLFCNWNTSWWKIRDSILNKMQENNFYQGQYMRKDLIV
ncbi:TIGR01212 family radical SAM protein [Anaerosphaera multitolerans]|uniref:TIGR01212 family radical SAM protein n=1 Tax=Anaerosphaera multitolerans TaxID=2487351 RepID=A0A437S8L8_9FIRM|nr:TIGR01212 family radical SAM protein [Anaerosphaera multitolerans]RVU55188.1 TIGR01212 family radical SAM protein [Anaerosphaera multitolerans]